MILKNRLYEFSQDNIKILITIIILSVILNRYVINLLRTRITGVSNGDGSQKGIVLNPQRILLPLRPLQPLYNHKHILLRHRPPSIVKHKVAQILSIQVPFLLAVQMTHTKAFILQ